MRMPPMSRRRWIIAVGCLLFFGAVLVVLLSENVRPSNPFAGVVEPITFTRVSNFLDGGSVGLEFTDANQKTFWVCRVAPEFGGNFILGSFSPKHDEKELRKYPVGGAGDWALLEVLERWSRRDPDFKFLELGYQQPVRGGLTDDAYAKEIVVRGLVVKFYAMRFLRELRQRKRGSR